MIEVEQHEKLQAEKERGGVPIAEQVRRILDMHFGTSRKPAEPSVSTKPSTRRVPERVAAVEKPASGPTMAMDEAAAKKARMRFRTPEEVAKESGHGTNHRQCVVCNQLRETRFDPGPGG